MRKNREHSEIIYDILISIREKEGIIKPTHILYKSNLSQQMMEEYLNELIQNGLIIQKKLERYKTYILTEKGNSYIEKYKFIRDFMDSYGLNK